MTHTILKQLFEANFEKEYEFFRKHVNNKRVLVAGSGLGHDSIELAKYNKEVVRIELIEQLLKISIERTKNFKNIKIIQGDFTKTSFENKSFDVSILNMGTIGNFDDERKPIIKELLKVSNKLYADFYIPTLKALELRKTMYEQEGYKNVEIQGRKIISSDRLDSKALEEKELEKDVKDLGFKVKLCKLNEFSIMSEIF